MVAFDRLHTNTSDFNCNSPRGGTNPISGNPASHKIGLHLAAADYGRTRSPDDGFGVSQVVRGGVRDDHQVHSVQIRRLDRAARILIQKRIYEDALAVCRWSVRKQQHQKSEFESWQSGVPRVALDQAAGGKVSSSDFTSQSIASL